VATLRQRLQLQRADKSGISVSADDGRDAEAAAVSWDECRGDGRGVGVAPRAGEDAEGDVGDARVKNGSGGWGSRDADCDQDEGGEGGGELHGDCCLGLKLGGL
jgi:hypothetical protein